MGRHAGEPLRPLVPVALAYAAGTAAGAAFFSFGACAAYMAVAIGGAIFFACPRRSRLVPVAVLAFGIAAMRGATAAGPADSSERDFARMVESDRQVTIKGEIASEYRITPLDDGRVRHAFMLKDASYRLRGRPRHLRSNVRVAWFANSNCAGAPERGDIVEAVGYVGARRAADSANPSADDVEFVTGAASTRILLRRGHSGGLAKFRHDAAQILSRGLDDMPEERDLILAMTLGMRSSLSQRTRDAFRRAGTIHIFAISGLHVGAMGVLMVAFLSFLGVERAYVFLALAPLLASYVYMTGMQPSAIRAALMVSIYFLALFVGRRPNTCDAVSLALIAILAWSPLDISQIGLVMSFAMVAGILLFTGPVTSICRRLAGCRHMAIESSLALRSEKDGDRWIRVYRWPRDFLIKLWTYAVTIAAASLSAALVSLPLTSHYFGILIPFSVLANIVVVPLSLPVMAISGFGLFLSATIPGVELVTNRIAAWLAWTMRAISEWAASLPHSTLDVRLPVIALAVWYLALLLLLRGIPGICGPAIKATADFEEPDLDE